MTKWGAHKVESNCDFSNKTETFQHLEFKCECEDPWKWVVASKGSKISMFKGISNFNVWRVGLTHRVRWPNSFHRPTTEQPSSVGPSPAIELSTYDDCAPKCLRSNTWFPKLGIQFLQKMCLESCLWCLVFSVILCGMKKCLHTFSHFCLLACLHMIGFRAHNGWGMMGECTTKGFEETN